MSFSYNIVLPLLQGSVPLRTNDYPEWHVIEKGHEKSGEWIEEIEIFTYHAVRSALSKIREHVKRTPLDRSFQLFPKKNFNIYLKKECRQYTNSVKARGVAYTLLQLSDFHKRNGVIAISMSNNFAQTLFYYGKKFKIPVTVVIPKTVPLNVSLMSSLDHSSAYARLRYEGNDILETHKIALDSAQKWNLFYLDGNDHPDMIAGQATLAIEIIEQFPEVDAVVLPALMDGCGFTLGIAAVLKSWNPNIKIFEVQSKGPNALVENIRSRTTLSNELEIPVKKYIIYKNRAGIKQYLFNRKYESNREQEINWSANYLLQMENIYDYHAAVGLDVLRVDALNDELNGKSVVIPLCGYVDFK